MEDLPTELHADDRRLKLLNKFFTLRAKKTIVISPATKANVARMLRVLEADYLRDGGGEDFAETIGHCRHTEFLPLLLRAIARLPENSSGSRQLLATVYASSDTPAAGFDALADYLASADPASAPEVFDYWHSEEVDHQWFQEAVRDLKDLEAGKSNNPEYQKDPESWKTFLRADIDAFRNSERHFDTRPTPEQLARLREIPNVWVRSLVYSYYPEQCPPEWAIRC